MRFRLPVAIVFVLPLLADMPDLMPMPRKVEMRQGKLALDGAFTVSLEGNPDARLQAAIEHSTQQLSRYTGLPISVMLHHAAGAKLVIESGRPSAVPPILGEDESYQLNVTAAGARLSAPTSTGVLRGMATVMQLVTADSQSFYLPAVEIADKPRFPWRGVMLDCSRHWMPVPVIERNLEAMAAVKMNVFHWHLSDDQGFRVESKRFPQLQQKGSDGFFYTQEDVRRVIAHATALGIRVVPEFDVPGHTTSWFVSMPELASAPGPYEIERKWGIFAPTIDPTKEEVYQFLDAFIGEMAALFPDEYFHIGGDEVEGSQWKNSERIQEFSRQHQIKDDHALQAYFTKRVQQLVTKHGKKTIGWDEVLHDDSPKDLMIQSWRGHKSLAEAARKGYSGILSFGYYLDHMDPASFHYAIDPLNDDVAAALNPADASRILGGEACMWTEYVTEDNVDSRLWPRAGAVAERLWSPAEVKDNESMYRRMAGVSRRLDWTGVEHRSSTVRALDRYAGGQEAAALQVLIDAVEATGIGLRQAAKHYSHDMPLNRLVDAARPESESVLALERVARRVANGSPQRSDDYMQIRRALLSWRENHARLLPLLHSQFVLEEAVPVSESLSELGSLGLEALEYIANGRPAPAEWLQTHSKQLTEMEKPRAEVQLAAVRPVQILLTAAARSSHQAKAMR